MKIGSKELVLVHRFSLVIRASTMEVGLLLLMQCHALPVCVGGTLLMVNFLSTRQRSLFSQLSLDGGLLSEVHRLVEALELLMLGLGISVLSGLSVSLLLRIVRG